MTHMTQYQNDRIRKLCIGALLPILLVCIVILLSRDDAPPLSTDTAQTQPTTAPDVQSELHINVLFGEEKREMLLDDYLVGVVIGEMPTTFETEALRAQAVAARTYTLKKCAQGSRHGENTVCTDYNCCQAYTAPDDYLAAGGQTEFYLRVKQAVGDTAGQVIVYDGELIMATYFSCAGGQTESAVAVWGQDYPYLQSVASPGEEDAAHYTDSVTFSAAEFQQALGVRLEGKVENWFGTPSYTEGGGVETMSVCGIPYRGTTLRTLLGLRSTDFTVSVKNGAITFYTKGFGHRVGMSQYGANAMAKAGSSYREILTHYYTGAQIVQYAVGQ